MNEPVIDADKQRVLNLQSGLVQQHRFFLGGGTGLALRLGHRTSRDLDWFTPQTFDVKSLARQLAGLPEKPTKATVQGEHTLRAYYGKLETSFLRYRQVQANPELLTVGAVKVPVADIETLAVMKAAAVHDRGARRDFIDIHAICSRPEWSVGRFIELATKKLPLQSVQVKLALTYFPDAEKDPVRSQYAVSWEQVKADLQRGVLEWERSRSRGLDR
jgi:hypothetical protein